ncbi:YjbF family lipoprotein [Polynucleobacter sp. MG-28-Ekke-A2]|uniref:YjbF family lipoprotein n=1 Tax=Polynucleobacter sp. MG-28-Ekke-A2 TaxID=3108276 RepID=UPI002B22AC2C|nr:YjbF family lipoprotein [Polynucleobacter sp. MG-28-Ekke-A2]MEA9601212.1 YjbF family lipoprotein [Polynucleobacter sp. MG-28-Ekke-A2]
MSSTNHPNSGISILFLISRLVACILLTLSAIGCAGDKQNLIYDTFILGITSPNTVIDEAKLNQNYRYLKVEANGQPALLALGYVDQKKQSKHDVWFSAFKEVVEIKDGRLGNTEGLEVNWTEVSLFDAPPLRAALALNIDAGDKAKQKSAKLRYMRIRSVMPGYHVNIRETVVMEALTEIPIDIPKQLKDPIANENIRWIQETVLVPPNNFNPSIKPLRAIYAINIKTNETVFGKQYLTPDFFVSWLTWPYPAPSKDNQPTK